MGTLTGRPSSPAQSMRRRRGRARIARRDRLVAAPRIPPRVNRRFGGSANGGTGRGGTTLDGRRGGFSIDGFWGKKEKRTDAGDGAGDGKGERAATGGRRRPRRGRDHLTNPPRRRTPPVAKERTERRRRRRGRRGMGRMGRRRRRRRRRRRAPRRRRAVPTIRRHHATDDSRRVRALGGREPRDRAALEPERPEAGASIDDERVLVVILEYPASKRFQPTTTTTESTRRHRLRRGPRAQRGGCDWIDAQTPRVARPAAAGGDRRRGGLQRRHRVHRESHGAVVVRTAPAVDRGR